MGFPLKPSLRWVNACLALGSPVTLLSAAWLKAVMKARGVQVGDASERIFMKLGLLPVVDHYYQPLINPKKHLTRPLRADRPLPGIAWNVDGQLALLAQFRYNEELERFPLERDRESRFHYNNDAFGPGDAEYLYNMVRHFRPRRIVEIGSGSSTLMARNAVAANRAEDPACACEQICIEPYEQPWLEQAGVRVLRQKVEEADPAVFAQLEANDILFIDSSHIIRPQGDVLFEYLQLLPALKTGVLVHVHDIFSPRDYPEDWVHAHRLWNEQYLLEAFLSFNHRFRILGALNYLAHNHREAFGAKCPIFARQPGREPGSFWMMRT